MNGAYLDSLGWVYFKLGQYEPAEDNLRKAVERTSTDPTVHDHLGDLYEKTGRIRLAAAQWEISLRNSPSPRPPTSSRPKWPRYKRSSKAHASSWPNRKATWAMTSSRSLPLRYSQTEPCLANQLGIVFESPSSITSGFSNFATAFTAGAPKRTWHTHPHSPYPPAPCRYR
jgi:tetratricopeptide (TPR) repeat protein